MKQEKNMTTHRTFWYHFTHGILLSVWLGEHFSKMLYISLRKCLSAGYRFLNLGNQSHINRSIVLPSARSGLSTVSHKKNFPESHTRNSLLPKFVWSRWLDIGLVLFLRVYGPWLWSINMQKKNLANIQPSWPHTWSIIHIYYDVPVVQEPCLYRCWPKEYLTELIRIYMQSSLFC